MATKSKKPLTRKNSTKKRLPSKLQRPLLFALAFGIMGAAYLVYSFAFTTPNGNYAQITGTPIGIGNSNSYSGAWVATTNGSIASLGNANFYGAGTERLKSNDFKAYAARPQGDGYWLATSDGGVHAFGSAPFIESLPGWRAKNPAQPVCPNGSGDVIDMASGNGHQYAMLGRCGIVYVWGSPYLGSVSTRPGSHLDVKQDYNDFVGIAIRPDNNGYWLVRSNGAVYAFGNASYHGGANSGPLNQPIVDIVGTPSGNGYWLFAKDGGVFSYGDAKFHGSLPQFKNKDGTSVNLAAPVVGAARTPDGNGYYMVGGDGGVFAFGNASFPGRVLAGEVTIQGRVLSRMNNAGYPGIRINTCTYGDVVTTEGGWYSFTAQRGEMFCIRVTGVPEGIANARIRPWEEGVSDECRGFTAFATGAANDYCSLQSYEGQQAGYRSTTSEFDRTSDTGYDFVFVDNNCPSGHTGSPPNCAIPNAPAPRSPSPTPNPTGTGNPNSVYITCDNGQKAEVTAAYSRTDVLQACSKIGSTYGVPNVGTTVVGRSARPTEGGFYYSENTSNNAFVLDTPLFQAAEAAAAGSATRPSPILSRGLRFLQNEAQETRSHLPVAQQPSTPAPCGTDANGRAVCSVVMTGNSSNGAASCTGTDALTCIFTGGSTTARTRR